MRCLGVDIGSSSIKGGILDLDTGRVAGTRKTPFPAPLAGQPAGWYEVPAAAVLAGVRQIVAGLLEEAPDAGRLWIANQMGGVILVDERLEPLTNYISWRDQRVLAPGGGPGAEALLDGMRAAWEDGIFTALGRELKPGSTTALLHWLSRHGRLPAGAVPLSIGDYCVAALCGAPPRVHRTNALGLLDLATGAWHREAFAAVGIADLRWPDLAADGETVGRVSCAGGLLDCHAAIADQQAALRGVDLGPDELSINCSTGSQVSRITATFEPAACQTRCWFGGRHLNTVTHIPAGRSLAVLEALLTELPRAAGLALEGSWPLIAAATAAAERRRDESAGDAVPPLTCDLSFFAGATGDRGRIDGITTENLSVGTLFLAAFEFMADSYLACSRRLAAAPTWNRVVLSGSLVESFPPLRRALARRFSLPFRAVDEQEETLLGLLHLARDS